MIGKLGSVGIGQISDARLPVGLSAALTPTVIRIQPPPLPDEYPRGRAVVLPGGGGSGVRRRWKFSWSVPSVLSKKEVNRS
jgi:hypothetical protein